MGILDRAAKEAEKEKARRAASGKTANKGIFAPPAAQTSLKAISPTSLVQSRADNTQTSAEARKQQLAEAREERVRQLEEKLEQTSDRRQRAAYRQQIMDVKHPLSGRDAKLSTTDKREIQEAKANWAKTDELEKKYGRTPELDDIKARANRAAERVRLRNGYSLGADGTTVYEPELSARERLLPETAQENLRQLKLYQHYGEQFGNAELKQWAEKEADKVREMWGTTGVQSTWIDRSDTDRSYLEGEVERAQAAVEQAQETLRAYTAQVKGMSTFGRQNGTLTRLQEAVREKQAALAEAKRRVERLDYVEKYDAKTYEETGGAWHDFWNQARANLDLGRINQDASQAYNEYLSNPTPANKGYAEALAALEGRFQERNADVLDDTGQVLPWLSESAARYLPQLKDQLVASAQGAAAGAALGGGVGFTAGGVGAVPGALWGARGGAVAGSGKYAYDTMRGAAFRSLVESGVDEATARAAANDEAVISSLIEMADTGVDIFTFGIGSALKAAGKAGTKTASKSAGKKLASALGKYGLNIGSEMAQEGAQEAVSMANADRILAGEDSGLWSLAKETVHLGKDAVTGKDQAARSQMWEAAQEGGKIAVLMGGAGMAVNAAANKGIRAALDQAGTASSDKAVGQRIQAQGDAMVRALAEEGLEHEETAYLASPVLEKLQAGETPNATAVGRLYRAMHRTKQARERIQENTQEDGNTRTRESADAPQWATAAPEETTLMQMAREMTASKSSQSTGTRDAAKKLGYGTFGTKAVAQLMERRNMAADEAKFRFQSAYEAGLANVPRERVSLLGDIQETAYTAGRQDYILTLNQAEDGSQYATQHGKESGFIMTDAAKGVDKQLVADFHKVSKSLGIRTMFVESIGTGGEDVVAGGYMTGDGVLVIAKNAANPYAEVFKHEVTHQLQKLAPKEYLAFRSLAVELENRNTEYGNITAVEALQHLYANGNVTLSTEEAMDELAANFAERLFTDGDTRTKTAERAAQDTQTRTVMEKFWQAVRAFLTKLKKTFRGDKAKMDEAAQERYGATIAEMEKAEGLWKEAYQAAAKRAREAKNATQEGGDVRFSIRESFAAEIQEWYAEGMPGREKFTLGSTGPVLQGLGAIESDIYMMGDKISTILNDHPEMSIREIKRIPEILEDPILVLRSKNIGRKSKGNSRLVIFGSVKGRDGRPVMCVLDLRPVERGFLLADMQKVSSAYTKDTNPVEFVKASSVLHADKKRTIPLLRSIGFQMPIALLRDGSVGSITYSGTNVNIEGVPFDQVVMGNATQEGDKVQKAGSLKYSLKMSFADQVDATLNRELERDTAVYVMDTPDILQAIGLKDYPMLMTQRHIRDINHAKSPKNHHWHGIQEATIKKLPDMIENPLIMMESATAKGDLVLVTSELDEDGLPIVVSIHPDGNGQYNRAEIASNFVTSMYGKDGFGTFVDNAVNDGRVLYNSKKRTQSLFAKVGLQLPKLLTSDGFFKNKVAQPDAKVKTQFSIKEYRALLKENAKLREVNAGLKEQFKTTTFAKVDKRALEQFTRELLKDYSSQADTHEVQGMLDEVYTYLANGDAEGTSWNEAYKRAYETAVSVLDAASELDDQLWQSYQSLRDYLRTTGIKVNKEDASGLMGYENLEDFRRRNFGRLKITDSGTPVDILYQDLAVRYPEFFDESRDMNPADQLNTIVETLDQLRPVEVNPYSYHMREAATWLANDILERFYTLPQAKPTFADKAAGKLTQQVIRDTKKLERLRTQKNARIATLIADNRERVKTIQATERTKRETAVQQIKEHYKAKEGKASQARTARELRGKIIRHAKALSDKLVKPTDKQHIPESLRGAVAAMLESINLESQYSIDETGKRTKDRDGAPTKRTEAFLALKEQYTQIAAQGGDLVIDPSLLGSAAEGIQGSFDAVIEMQDIRLADMSVQQLTTVWQVVRAVEHSVRMAGKTLSQAKYQRTEEWAGAMMTQTASRRIMRMKLKEAFRVDMETPFTFFSHYGEAGKAIFRMLRDAQDKQLRMVEAVAEQISQIVSPQQVKSWEKETHNFTTERGDSLTLSTAHCMELYELRKRKQAEEHLLQGGIVQPEVESEKISRGTHAVRLTQNDLKAMVEVLTDEQLQVADKLQTLTCTLLADFGNEASMQAYGYKKFTEPDYWPIKSAREGIHSNIEKGGDNPRSIKNIGMAKNAMPHASNPLDVKGIFQTFSEHTGDMTDYAAWLCPMEDAQRLYNYEFRDENGNRSGRTIKGLLDDVGGRGSQQYWHNLMKNIQNGVSGENDSVFVGAISKLVGNVKGASVGANLRVIVQQPTAILRAAAILNPADMAAGLVSGGGWKTALAHSDIAKRKNMGGFDISSPMQLQEILFDKKKGLQRFSDAMMTGAAKADAITWGRIWNACEVATRRQNKELKKGSDAFYTKTAQLFGEVIDQSQVVDGVLQRAQVMRSGSSILKQATSFMGEPIMSLNMLLRAYDSLVHETDSSKRGAARKVVGRTAVVLLMTNVVNALAQSLVDAARDDDAEKKYWERFRAAFTGLTGEEESRWEKVVAVILSGNLANNINPVGYIPIAKDALSILQGYSVTRMDADVMEDIIQANQTFLDSLTGEGKRTLPYALKNLASKTGKAFGISAPNILRDVWAVMRSIAIETENVAVQYEMEKAIYKLDNSQNTSRFLDILYRAYQEDEAVYQRIYSDMVAGGIEEEAIAKGMEKRMKKDQGVEHTEDLADRYLSPDAQKKYDTLLKDLTASTVWSEANTEQQKVVKEDLYDLTVKNADGLKLQEKINEGASYGIDETDYLLYKLALAVADQPSEQGKLGSYTNAELAQAVLSTGLSDGEKAYLWWMGQQYKNDEPFDALDAGISLDTYIQFKVFDSQTTADKDENGKSISGSKKEKIIRWLNEHSVGQDAYHFFMYQVKGYKS